MTMAKKGMAQIMRLVLALALVVGCAKGARTDWSHPTKSDDEFHQDAYACQVERAEMRIAPVNRATFFNACMRARGWRDK
jgi:hypothetical protein